MTKASLISVQGGKLVHPARKLTAASLSGNTRRGYQERGGDLSALSDSDPAADLTRLFDEGVAPASAQMMIAAGRFVARTRPPAGRPLAAIGPGHGRPQGDLLGSFVADRVRSVTGRIGSFAGGDADCRARVLPSHARALRPGGNSPPGGPLPLSVTAGDFGGYLRTRRTTTNPRNARFRAFRRTCTAWRRWLPHLSLFSRSQ